ncbi:MAG: DUF3307 domain-containing protein [bacterium]|nr:DUF3307 domain-containing protein [bacterium]
MDNFTFFSLEQGNLLIRLIVAHLLADFAFQSSKMVDNKKWFSKEMLLHLGVVYVCTACLSGWWLGALVIAILHYLIDGFKIEAKKHEIGTELKRFLLDQALHIISIVVVWMLAYNLYTNVTKAFVLPFSNYKISLILLGYLIVILPVGYIIKFATLGMQSSKLKIEPEANNTDGNSQIEKDKQAKNEHGGKMIGIFERIIILTFVLLGQYEAIGFLITGKSIIRFASHDENIKSEYVLVGTMMSYSISIIAGVLINWLISLII